MTMRINHFFFYLLKRILIVFIFFPLIKNSLFVIEEILYHFLINQKFLKLLMMSLV